MTDKKNNPTPNPAWRQRRPGAVIQRSGCFQCHGGEAHWHGNNAQDVAANHAYKTGHETWCDVTTSFRYGPARDGAPDTEAAPERETSL